CAISPCRTRRSTCTAAPARWATRSARRARASWSRCSPPWRSTGRRRAWPRSALAAAKPPPWPSSARREDDPHRDRHRRAGRKGVGHPRRHRQMAGVEPVRERQRPAGCGRAPGGRDQAAGQVAHDFPSHGGQARAGPGAQVARASGRSGHLRRRARLPRGAGGRGPLPLRAVRGLPRSPRRPHPVEGRGVDAGWFRGHEPDVEEAGGSLVRAMFFYVAKIVWFLAQPSSLIAIALSTGAILTGTAWRKLGRRLLIAGLAALLVCGLSPLSEAL